MELRFPGDVPVHFQEFDLLTGALISILAIIGSAILVTPLTLNFSVTESPRVAIVYFSLCAVTGLLEWRLFQWGKIGRKGNVIVIHHLFTSRQLQTEKIGGVDVRPSERNAKGKVCFRMIDGHFEKLPSVKVHYTSNDRSKLDEKSLLVVSALMRLGGL